MSPLLSSKANYTLSPRSISYRAWNSLIGQSRNLSHGRGRTRQTKRVRKLCPVNKRNIDDTFFFYLIRLLMLIFPLSDCGGCNLNFSHPIYYRLHCCIFHDTNYSLTIRKYHCKVITPLSRYTCSSCNNILI